jgi:hypothetical protein
MAMCDRIRPLLYRLAEQEADPAEAIEAARHLPRCTACKILLARERRLAVLLERELIDLAVDETFVRDVMDTLPAAPPRRAAPIRVLRGLKLALLAGLVLLGGGAGDGQALPVTATPWFAAPTVDVDGPSNTGSPVLVVAALTVRAIATAVPALLSHMAVPGTALRVGAALALLVVLLGSGLLALALAGWYARPSPARPSRAARCG